VEESPATTRFELTSTIYPLDTSESVTRANGSAFAPLATWCPPKAPRPESS